MRSRQFTAGLRRPFFLTLLAVSGVFLLACSSEEESAFNRARSRNTVEAYEAFLDTYPESELASRAESLLVEALPPILFTSDREESFTSFSVKADGTGEARLTQSEEADLEPKLSPDGTRIVFMTNRDDDSEIYVMNADGSDPVRLTHESGLDAHATWSPDGNRIAFVSDRGGNAEIYMMNADGTGVVRLTDDGGADAYPTWSPDGERIAFARHPGEGRSTSLVTTIVADYVINGRDFTSIRAFNGDIYVVNVDGSGLTRLTDDPANDSHPTWSPDGSRIAFSSSRDGNDEIYVMNADGSNPVRLTSDEASDHKPLWYPAWDRILFDSDRGGDLNVWMMDPDGTGLVQLTSDPGDDSVR